MVYAIDLGKGFSSLSNDGRINVWHISLYASLLYLYAQNGFINPIPITRKIVMKYSHINSVVTYHKCIKQLQEFGYIKYVPSYNSFLGSYISIVIP